MAMVRSDIAAGIAALPGVEQFRRRAWNGVLVVSYHRVGEPRGTPFDRNAYSATPEAFDRQVAHLTQHCDVIGPSELDAAVNTPKGQFALITFDDGYRDNFEQAIPILSSHGATASFFPVTSFLDEPTTPWWDEIAWMVRASPRKWLPSGGRLLSAVVFDDPDREQAVRALLTRYYELPASDGEAYLDELAEATASGRLAKGAHAEAWLTWDMVRAMRDAGMSIGGHTMTHPLLSRLPPGEQRAEIDGCLGRLRDELGEDVEIFSYPVGLPNAFDDTTQACLRAAGVVHAFSHYGGHHKAGGRWDSLDIRRTSISRNTSDARFWATTASPARFAKW